MLLDLEASKFVREHFKQFIYNKEPSPFPAEIQQRNYGRIYELRKMGMLHKFIIKVSKIKFSCILSCEMSHLNNRLGLVSGGILTDHPV